MSSFHHRGGGPQNVNQDTGAQFNNNVDGLQAIHSVVHYSTTDINQDTQCLRDLRLSDPRHDKARIESTKGGLLGEASNWILSHPEFLEWRNGDARLLWIKGDPGKGKTMLLITIVKELEQQLKKSNDASVLSYFFCQGTDQNLNNATAVLRGLLYLLASENRHLISHIRSRYDNAGQKFFQEENSFFVLSEVLESMLHDESLSEAYIVIDALDECAIKNRHQLLKLIERLTIILPHVKWAVSSRNKPEIEEYLALDASGIKLGLETTGNAQQVSRAVNAFIDDRISNIRSLKDDSNKKKRVQRVMQERANGTFLWVALVFKELERAKGWRLMNTIETLPAGLTDLYRLIIDEIEQEGEWEYCQLILSAATLAYCPLHITELAVLSGLPDEISTNVEYVQEVIDVCSSLLTVQEDIIYLIHQSAKDYLSDTAFEIVFPAGRAEGHRRMMDLSLQIMRRVLRRDIYGLGQPGLSIEEIEIPSPDPLASVRYSCIHWISHYCDICSEIQDKPDGASVNQFIQQFYLYWLEALALIRHLGDGVLSVTRLRNLAKKQSWDQQFINLTEDLYRFIRQNKWVIENTPLQLYTSALIFSPTNSIIRKLFTKEEPGWIKIKPKVEKNWSLCQQTLEGHGHSVYSVAFSPDSKLVASGSHDDTIKIWEAATGALQQTLEGHNNWVNSVAFSPDSKLVASGSHDFTIKIWEAATGALQQTLKGHGGWVNSVVFSPDSKLVASGSIDNTIKIWEAVTGALQQTLKGHGHSVYSVAFSLDSKLVASGSYDHTVKIWEAATGALQQTLKGHGHSVNSVAFSPDSKLVASGSHDHTVKIWEVTTGILQQTFEGHCHWVYSVAFSPDSKLVASGSHDSTVKIWEAATGTLQQTLEGHSNWVYSVAFSPDSKLVASGSDDRTVKIWEATTGALQQTLEGHSDWVNSVAFSLDSKLVASGSDDYTVKIWEAATGALQHTLKRHGHSVYSVAFSPDSKLVASGSDDRTVKIWEAATGTLQQTLERKVRSASYVFSSSSPGLDQISLHPYDITSDKSWISWNGQKVMWLPSDYRPLTSAISHLASPSGSSVVNIALGMRSGKVTIIGFLASGPNMSL